MITVVDTRAEGYNLPKIKGSYVGRDDLNMYKNPNKGIGIDTIKGDPFYEEEPITKREKFISSMYNGSSLEDMMINFQQM